nr:hypothetical protein [Candidatus Sumerlaeota bacterium]
MPEETKKVDTEKKNLEAEVENELSPINGSQIFRMNKNKKETPRQEQTPAALSEALEPAMEEPVPAAEEEP